MGNFHYYRDLGIENIVKASLSPSTRKDITQERARNSSSKKET
jgi:hypothetical protein